MERTYPYTAWVLQPSFKPKEVTFVEHVEWWGDDYGCRSQSGKVYGAASIHATKGEALAFGWKEVARMKVDLDKRQLRLNKKMAALAKAAE